MTLTHSLHSQAVEAAKRFKQAEADLVEIFQKIEEAKVFFHLGYTSLFDYGVKALGLSEANTYAFIQVARKSREVPALKEAIQDGKLTLSKATRLTSVITQENQTDWLNKATTISKVALEKEIARENPKAAVRESAKFVAEDRIELKLGISEKLMKILKRTQDVESQRCQKAASLEETLEVALEEYLERHDPLRKAERSRPQLCPAWVYRSSATPGKLKRAN